MVDINLDEFEIAEPTSSADVTAREFFTGKLLSPIHHIFQYSSDEWEVFLREWAQFQKSQYHKVVKLGGANDWGIDIAGFCSDQSFEGVWDNYQCKHLANSALTPAIAIPEIGKVLWHAYEKRITLPRKFYFFAPRDCGPSLQKLLLNPQKLKDKLIDEWDNWCSTAFTTTKKIELKGGLSAFVEDVDFSIFEYKPVHEVIEEHRETPFFYSRFGGGLPDRPQSTVPPDTPQANESRYISQLFEAYSDKENLTVTADNLVNFGRLQQHLERERVSFFHAESLELFVRDIVPNGTFSSLQNEIYSGVIDICESDHPNGFERAKSVAHAASTISLDANGLVQVTKVQDKRGICHQLANMDQLIWVPEDE